MTYVYIINDIILKGNKMDKSIMAKLIEIDKFTGVPISDRDLEWYRNAAFHSALSNAEMELYDTVFNSDVWHKVTEEPPRTNGFLEVDKHIDKIGIRSENTEYMWELSHLDCWINEILKTEEQK